MTGIYTLQGTGRLLPRAYLWQEVHLFVATAGRVFRPCARAALAFLLPWPRVLPARSARGSRSLGLRSTGWWVSLLSCRYEPLCLRVIQAHFVGEHAKE